VNELVHGLVNGLENELVHGLENGLENVSVLFCQHLDFFLAHAIRIGGNVPIPSPVTAIQCAF